MDDEGEDIERPKVFDPLHSYAQCSSHFGQLKKFAAFSVNSEAAPFLLLEAHMAFIRAYADNLIVNEESSHHSLSHNLLGIGAARGPVAHSLGNHEQHGEHHHETPQSTHFANP